MSEASNYIPAASISPLEGPWQQIPGGVTAAKGFKAAWMDCEPKEGNLILHLLLVMLMLQMQVMNRKWASVIISKLPPFLSFTSSPSSEMAGGAIISKFNLFTESASLYDHLSM